MNPKTPEQWIYSFRAECSLNPACTCDRCKEGIEVFLMPRDIEAIRVAALREAAERIKDMDAYCGGHGEPGMPSSGDYEKAILSLIDRKDGA